MGDGAVAAAVAASRFEVEKCLEGHCIDRADLRGLDNWADEASIRIERTALGIDVAIVYVGVGQADAKLRQPRASNSPGKHRRTTTPKINH